MCAFHVVNQTSVIVLPSTGTALNAACFSLTLSVKHLHGLTVHTIEDVALSGPVEPCKASHLQPVRRLKAETCTAVSVQAALLPQIFEHRLQWTFLWLPFISASMAKYCLLYHSHFCSRLCDILEKKNNWRKY